MLGHRTIASAALSLLAAFLLQLAAVAQAQDDPEEALRELVSQVGARLEYALRLRQDSAIDLDAVRIEYVVSGDGKTAEGASVGLRAPGVADEEDDPFRQVCWALHPLQGEQAYQMLLDRPRETGTRPLDMTLSVGSTLATEWCECDASRLACVIGHELGHVLLGHLVTNPERGPDVLELARLDQEREFAADEVGIELAQAAGYPDAVAAATAFWQRVAAAKGDTGVLEPEAVMSTHPSISSRIVAIQTDPERKRRWCSLMVYDYGLTYLQIGDWCAAQDCFERALGAFPQSSEVLCNLAYCKMMRYYSTLSESERTRLQGEVSCQAFITARPPICGGAQTDKTPLREAVLHLQTVLAQRPDDLAARVMLGTATVMDPDADTQSLRQAAQAMAAAAQEARRLQGAASTARDKLSAADLFADALTNGALAQARAYPEQALATYHDAWLKAPVESPIQPLQLNYAAALVAHGDQEQIAQARELLSDYLRNVSEESYYLRTAQALWDRAAAGRDDAQTETPRRPKARWLPTKSVGLANGRTVSLGSDWEIVQQGLRGQELCRIPAGGADELADYRDMGLQLRISRGVVKGILLVSPAAPEVVLSGSRIGTGPTLCLRVGQKGVILRRDGDEQPGGEEQLGDRTYRVTIGGREYSVYRDCQLAIAWEGDTIAAIAMLGA